MSILLWVDTIVILVALLVMLRNSLVYRYRTTLIAQMHERSMADIHAGRDPWWRHKVYDQVSYNQMMFKFWKPLKSFYPDKSFINSQESN